MNDLFDLQYDHPLFRYLEGEQRERLESLAEEIRVESGEYLIRKNDQDSTLFAVLAGRLEIVVGTEGEERVLATVGPGDVLGEVSFIDDSPRSVSVRAGETTVVRAWRKDILTAVLRNDPWVLARFSAGLNMLLVERLRDTVARQGSFRPV